MCARARVCVCVCVCACVQLLCARSTVWLHLHALTSGLLPQLATPIKTCLSDEDSVTRKWSCLLMQYTYALMEGKCTQEEVSEIYHDLVKRLDDSNNEVCAVCCVHGHPRRILTACVFTATDPSAHMRHTVYLCPCGSAGSVPRHSDGVHSGCHAHPHRRPR